MGMDVMFLKSAGIGCGGYPLADLESLFAGLANTDF